MGVRRLLLDTAAEMSAPPGDGSKPPIGGDFDTGMVIILAALLCALIGALGLNSIVRCAMRCGGGDRPAEAASGGMKKRELRRIPVAEYGEGAGISGAECAICLADFAEGEKVRVLPRCGHGFHVACIDRWLLSRSSCPNCRHSLLESKSGGGGGRRSESESGGGAS